MTVDKFLNFSEIHVEGSGEYAEVHVKIFWQLSVASADHIALISTCSVLAKERAQMSKLPQPATTPGVNGISVIHTQAHASGLQQVPQLVPAGPGGGGKAVPPSKQSKKSSPMDRNSDEYRQRRERNNMAVKKSRLKSKQKAQDTLQRVNQLKEENERLEAKIKLLTKELISKMLSSLGNGSEGFGRIKRELQDLIAEH
ncbi:hypothetical protein A6R68_16355 [Neotoma lepida]|uniref:CCAAT/enhancer-binding protein gamma n=1 Tax=Neotoma lepida TaxID=56216 RepID=A0A1A6HG18_NEOLE|nr:hypothetical protein A6R68_16355 [Neotoma lepida]